MVPSARSASNDEQSALFGLGSEEMVAVIEIENFEIGLEPIPGRENQVRRGPDRGGSDDDGRQVKDEPEIHSQAQIPASGTRQGILRLRDQTSSR